MTQICHIALGANLPTTTRTPLEVLRHALELLKDESIDVAAVSRWYATPAFPAGSGPDYVNGAARLLTTLEPLELLNRLNEIEQKLGRERQERWGARVCDLDILSYSDLIVPDIGTYKKWRQLPLEAQKLETPGELILPHPRLQDRAFVLVPLKDISPDWVHPVTGTTVDQLISGLPKADVMSVKEIDQ